MLKHIFLIFVTLIFSVSSLYATTVNCTVTRVLDGDTFHCNPDKSLSGVKLHKN